MKVVDTSLYYNEWYDRWCVTVYHDGELHTVRTFATKDEAEKYVKQVQG